MSTIRSFVFSQKEGRVISQDIAWDLLAVFLKDEGVQFWVDADCVSDKEAKDLLDGVFHFHPLAIEDCLTPSERPKIDEYEGYIFMVMHSVVYDRETREFMTRELNMFVGKNFFVTFHREPLKCIDSTLDRIAKNAPAVAKASDRLTYTVLDFLLGNYEPALEALSREIDKLEANVIESPGINILSDVMHLKTEVLKLHQSVWPQREVISRLAHGEFKIVRQHMLPYYRDLLDQLMRIGSQIENNRDSLTNTLQVHLSLQQVQMNRVMKVLTLLATLSMPLLLITSFYGMNFRHWPPSDSPNAYWWVTAVTMCSTLFLYLVLRRKGWW